MTITRRLPNSDLTRVTAINAAHNKNGLTPPGTGPLSANTITRLNTMFSDYNTALTNRGVAKSGQTTNTPAKDAQMEHTRTFVNHFIQVFNLGVRRGKYPAGHRSFYQLEVGSDAVPDLESEANVLTWANRIVTGDPLRVAAGGAAMTNPDVVEVQTSLTATMTLFNSQSTLADALDAAEESVETLNALADSLIKRIWDEVEAFFGEEAPASMRENARRWGVVYITTGPAAVLVGFVKDSGGVVQVGREVTLLDSGATAITDSNGRYEIETHLTGQVTLTAHPGEAHGMQIVNIPEHTTGITINVPDIIW